MTLPSILYKVICKSLFKIYHQPHNHHHSNDFDESEFCKSILG